MKNPLALFRVPFLVNADTFRPERLRNRTAAMRAYRQALPSIPARPVVLQLEVTNRCTMNCPMCPRSKMTRPLADMDFDLFSRIIDDNRGTAELAILHLLGEPLLHPRLPDMVQACRAAGIRTVISTNASVLTEKLSRRLIDSGLDMIIFSLDALDPETYASVRKGGHYEQIITNVNRFMEIRPRGGPFAVAQIIEMPETRGQVEPFIRHWRRQPGMLVSVKPYSNWQGDIDEIRQRGGPSPCTPSLDRNLCDRLWMWLTVYADGRLATCCRDYNGDVRLPSLGDQPSREAWNGPDIVAFRAQHRQGRSTVDLCRQCDYCSAVGRSAAARAAACMLDPLTLLKLMHCLEREA